MILVLSPKTLEIIELLKQAEDRMEAMLRSSRLNYSFSRVSQGIEEFSDLSAEGCLEMLYSKNNLRHDFMEQFAWIEVDRIGYESDFYRYIEGSGSDAGFVRKDNGYEFSSRGNFYQLFDGIYEPYEKEKRDFFSSPEYLEMEQYKKDHPLED